MADSGAADPDEYEMNQPIPDQMVSDHQQEDQVLVEQPGANVEDVQSQEQDNNTDKLDEGIFYVRKTFEAQRISETERVLQMI